MLRFCDPWECALAVMLCCVYYSVTSAQVAAPLLHRMLGHPLAFVVVAPALHYALFLLVAKVADAAAADSLRALVYISWGTTILSGLKFWIASGPTVWIKNTVSINISTTHELVSQYIQHKPNLASYEQKVTGCDAHIDGFSLWGSWWGLPWCKRFKSAVTADGGFKATVDDQGYTWVPGVFSFRGCGGFSLIQERDGVKLTHYESYGWPISFPMINLLAFWWREWHLRGMQVEMAFIRDQLELVRQNKLTSGMVKNTEDEEPIKYGCASYLKEKMTSLLVCISTSFRACSYGS